MLTLALSAEEQTMWRNVTSPDGPVPFIECVDPMAIVMRRTGGGDRADVVRAFAALIRRHSVLRSCYDVSDGIPVRRLRPADGFALCDCDLRHLPQGEREREAAVVVNAAIERSYDLASGPLIRALDVALANDDHVVALVFHHLAFDAWSMEVVRRELRELLRQQGDAATLPALPAGYGEYVEWQRRELEGGERDRLCSFWRRRFDGGRDVRIAPPGLVATAASTASNYRLFSLAAETVSALRALSRERIVTLATTTVAVLALLVHELTATTEVAIGIPASGRPVRTFEGVVGLFMNALPARVSIVDNPRFSDLLTRIWKDLVAAHEHRAFPYEEMLEALGTRKGGPAPFRVVLNFTRTPMASPVLSGLVNSAMAPTRRPPSGADLSLHVVDDGHTLRCCFLYRRDLLTEGHIDDLVGRFVGLSTVAARDPESRVAQLASAAPRQPTTGSLKGTLVRRQ